jgi:hypothetical protein
VQLNANAELEALTIDEVQSSALVARGQGEIDRGFRGLT